jgi:hypothetical protein
MMPVMSRLAHPVTSVRPGSRVWWAGVLVTAAFLFWFNAVAVHALTEPHLGGPGHHHAAAVDDCARGEMHSHEQDCHPPQLASDHGYLASLRSLGAAPPTYASMGTFNGAPPSPTVGVALSLLEPAHHPGADPPNTAQPRAPPSI